MHKDLVPPEQCKKCWWWSPKWGCTYPGDVELDENNNCKMFLGKREDKTCGTCVHCYTHSWLALKCEKLKILTFSWWTACEYYETGE